MIDWLNLSVQQFFRNAALTHLLNTVLKERVTLSDEVSFEPISS